MGTSKDSKSTPEPIAGRQSSKFLGHVVKIFLIIGIAGGAMAAYKYQMATVPKAQRKKPLRQAKLVRISETKKSRHATVVEAMGPVIPAHQVTLQPQVAGQITEISDAFIPGGIACVGERLITIDPRDYEIVVQQRQGSIVQARKDLKVEQGSQAVARQEYELLGEVISEEDRELVLREPQLASTQAALESVEAALRKAQLDLERCHITVPFNAIIQNKWVDLGTTVSLGSRVATLIGTDQAWIELKLSTSELKWLTIPQKNGEIGSSVTIYNTLAWGADRFRTGCVVRLYGELEDEGKMAQLLVAVDDPFCLKPENRDRPKLLLGSFVSAKVEGVPLESVFAIKRSFIHDKTVWIMDPNDQLEIRQVEILFAGPEDVLIGHGLTEGERLVVTDLATPVSGMPLQIIEPEAQTPKPASPMTSNKEGRP